MIKAFFRAFFKRFIGLFLSMTFVSALSISLLCTFGSTIINLKNSYRRYVNDYGEVDALVTTNFTMRSKFSDIKEQEGVENAYLRLTLDSYLKKDDGRLIVARLFTYNEEKTDLFDRYVVEKTEKNPNKLNISVPRKFANNNNFKLGDTIRLGYYDVFVEFYINEIVETVEGIYPRANDYVWSDNHDFGYLYVSEQEINKGLKMLANMVIDRIDSDPNYEEYYNRVLNVAGIIVPDLREVGDNYASLFANQIIVKAKDNYSEEQLVSNLDTYLDTKEVEVKSENKGSILPYRLYIENCIRQFQIATVFLPVFFYSVTMIVIGLFMNQIIKTMTPEIGIMMSIGVDKKDIISIFILFAFIMSLTAGIIGVFIGYFLNLMMANIMTMVYSIPILPKTLNIWVVWVGVVAMILFSESATALSTINILRITPKDATIANESKRKHIPRWLDKLILKAPMNIKLGVNSIAQNPRRFLVKSFSLFASYVLILLACFFMVAKDELIDQSVNRRLTFDCQVYLTDKASDSFIDDLSSQSFVKDFENCYYTYMKIDSIEDDIYIECIAIESGSSQLITIPNEKGKGQLPVRERGIVLTKSVADRIGVSKGDVIYINNKEIIVTDISFQYFHPICFMSLDQMDEIGCSYVSTFFINLNNENTFLTYLQEKENQCLTVFTRSLAKDLSNTFDSINIFIIIMVLFSLGMAFVILSIMSQNALMEQRRQTSVLRLIGYRVGDISNIWTFQSLLELIGSSIIAVPSGMLAAQILFNMCSSNSQTYPFIADWRVILFGFLFIFVVIVACHTISMFSIAKWNLADNTRSRE